jgi:hypothetical protein
MADITKKDLGTPNVKTGRSLGANVEVRLPQHVGLVMIDRPDTPA